MKFGVEIQHEADKAQNLDFIATTSLTSRNKDSMSAAPELDLL